MVRRTFLQLASLSTPVVLAQGPRGAAPEYNLVSAYKPTKGGFPGAYPAKTVCVKSGESVDPTGQVNAQAVRSMMDAGIQALTGTTSSKDAWLTFVQPSDVVGIKVNCSGAPAIRSSPEVVAEITRNLIDAGVSPQNIHIYDRFLDQIQAAGYDRVVPKDVQIAGIEKVRDSLVGYDPKTYVEVNFFGEENTRSNLVGLVTHLFTKIINVPVMKEHGAAGVTGCLKNIAYGNFSNVARSHRDAATHTYSFIGTLASMEPLRSKTVLNVMDGLNGVWHGGPFSVVPEYRFSPKQIFFGTDPVAMDRLLIDVIEAKRKQENAVSIWDRGKQHLEPGSAPTKPAFNHFIREPGHVEMAAKMGLGEYEKEKIQRTDLEI